MHTKTKLTLGIASMLLSVALIGCEDPAAAKPKAAVGSAKPTAAAAPSGKTATKPASAPAKGGFAIQASSSKLEWVGSKVTGKHEGGFKKFTGSASLADGKPEGGSVSVEIEMGSLHSDDDKLTGHMMAADFFEVEKYPKAKFTSTEIKAGGDGDATHTVTGNLELHGETKSITFPATIKVEGDKIGVKSEFSINRKQWGINYKGRANDLIRDDVVIKLDLALAKG